MRKAFTLIEIILTVAITTIIIGIFSVAIIDSLTAFSAISDTADLQNKAVTLNGEYQRLLKNATSAEILATTPSTFVNGSQYIYILNGEIYYRNGTSEPDIIFVTQNLVKDALFKRINDQTISADFTFSENKSNYILNTSTFMTNSTAVTGEAGRCIVYSNAVTIVPEVEEDFYLEEFKFDRSRNNTFNRGYFNGAYGYTTFRPNFGNWTALRDAPEPEYKGIIDYEKNTVDVYLPILKPAMNNWESSFMIPTIKIAGDDVSHYTFNTTNATAQKFYNSDVTLSNSLASTLATEPAKQISASFLGINQVFVHSKKGDIKMYSIFVHFKDPSYVESAFEKLTIIPTEKTVSPTTTDFQVLTTYTVNAPKIMMPTESHVLNALFQTNVDSYFVKWYAVETESQLKSFSAMSQSDKNKFEIATMEDTRTLDITTLPDDKKPIGKYVFFGVMTNNNGSDAKYSIANEFNQTTFVNPYVYLQLDYGKMWETTLNEVDYFYGDAFKVKTVENAYNLSSSFRNGYTGVDGIARKKYEDTSSFTYGVNGWDANSADPSLGIVNKDNYSNMTKSIKAGFLTNKLDFTYNVSLKDRTMQIKGDRKRDAYNNLSFSEDKTMTSSHFSLLALNTTNPFYTDEILITGTATAGLSASFTSEPKGIGGFSIAPLSEKNYTMPSGWLGFIEQIYFTGGSFDIIFNRNDANKGFKDGYQTKFTQEEPGVKLVAKLDSTIRDNYKSPDNRRAIGAANADRPHNDYMTTPYNFYELSKESGPFLEPDGKINLTVDILGNFSSSGLSGKLVALRLTNEDTAKKSNLMFFGEFSRVSNNNSELFKNVFDSSDDFKYKFTYGNGSTAKINGVPSSANVSGYNNYVYPKDEDSFGTLFVNKADYMHISAWGYDDSMGPVDFTITNIQPISEIK